MTQAHHKSEGLNFTYDVHIIFQLKEERLRKLFGEKGMITDCSMKYTKDGHFRRFAFIGYKTEKEAQDALQSFNKTYIDTTRIQVSVILVEDF